MFHTGAAASADAIRELMMVVYLVMLACAALMVALIHRYDLYDKEPPAMIGLAILLGMGIMTLAGAAERWLFDMLAPDPAQIMSRVTIVALVEDSFKLIAVLLIARWFMRHFNDPLDGVIYGTLIGLGAGIEESLVYLADSSMTLSTAGTEIIRLFAHAMMGGLLGLGVGLGARPGHKPKHHVWIIAICGLCSFTFHFAWDWIAYQPQLAQANRAVFIVLMALLLGAWGAVVQVATRRSCVVFTGRLCGCA